MSRDALFGFLPAPDAPEAAILGVHFAPLVAVRCGDAAIPRTGRGSAFRIADSGSIRLREQGCQIVWGDAAQLRELLRLPRPCRGRIALQLDSGPRAAGDAGDADTVYRVDGPMRVRPGLIFETFSDGGWRPAERLQRPIKRAARAEPATAEREPVSAAPAPATAAQSDGTE